MGVVLKRGDVFCVSGNMGWLSNVIRVVQRFWSTDNAAEYSHAGIIISESGETLEALWTVTMSSLTACKGKHVIIARPVLTLQGTPVTNVEGAIEQAFTHLGCGYPVWRLVLNLIPPLGKYVSSGKFLVCSELQAFYLYHCAVRPRPYTGVNPDTLADEYRRWKAYDVIFEGVWE